MTSLDPENLHRSVKLELDDGRAHTLAEAFRIVGEYKLGIEVGDLVSTSPTVQAALLTAVATAVRSFLGGVYVKSPPNADVITGPQRDVQLDRALADLGARIVDVLPSEIPLIRIGFTAAPVGGEELDPVVYVQTEGWLCSVSPVPRNVEIGFEMELAGVLGGALGVSEAFQWVRGDVTAMRRELRISLWCPDSSADSAQLAGPKTFVLPKQLWLIGLGHLGQAYAWGLTFLPFESPEDVTLVLQDSDVISEANQSTSLFASGSNLGHKKTRVVSAALERLGFSTKLLEQRFEKGMHRPVSEPGWALGGLDQAGPRRWVHAAGFDRYVDAGIGSTPDTYLDILIHTFPSQLTAHAAFPVELATVNAAPLKPAYLHMEASAVSAGLSPGDARCGVIEVASRAVGVPFVGAVAGCLVFADVLRALNGAQSDLAVLNINLRSPASSSSAANGNPVRFSNPGFTRMRTR